MSAKVQIQLEGVGAVTLDTLGSLIEQRVSVMGETVKDAVVATAINALMSLRASTRSAKKNKRLKSTIVQESSLYSSWNNRRRCLRRGGRNGAQFTPPEGVRVRYLTNGALDRDLQVFKVTSEHENIRPYYVVAPNISIAAEFEKKAASHRIARYGNLGKWALGVAMNKLSTRNVNDDVSGAARLAGSNLSFVEKTGGGFNSGTYSVTVRDNLKYAVAALKLGRADVNNALQRAANRTAAIINRFSEKYLPLSAKSIPTPFPEVRRQKR